MLRNSTRFALIATLAAALLAATLAPAAAADSPALLGTFKSWSAYTTGKGEAKICYALAQPKSSEPKNIKRDPVFFLISDWPARKTKDETEVVPGYSYKNDDKVTVQVGSDKYAFFAKNDDQGGDGNAWIQDLSSESRLVDAMRHGAEVIVTGTSSRGTLTRDTYSLAGISAALDKIHAACGL